MEMPNHIKNIAVLFSVLIGGIGGFTLTKIIFSLDTMALLNSLDEIPVFFTFIISFLVISYILLVAFAYVIYIADK
ncbi:hypothetical protein [Ursidibacter sp. B-7004-1]